MRANPLEAALAATARALRNARKRWALIGGLAVSARAEPRTTRDVDVAVLVEDDREAEALILRLQRSGFVVVSVLEHDRSGRLATVRLLPPREPPGGILVDLLFASSGIEPEIARDAARMEIVPGLRVPVATIGHLLAMKTLARDDRRRPQDRVDLVALLSEAGEQDLQVARESLRLIAERGYGRGRALLSSFERVVRDHSAQGYETPRPRSG